MKTLIINKQMKKIFFLIFAVIVSCKPQKLEVQQIISDEKASIFPHYENNHPDSINMKIPTEYKFNIKSEDAGFPPLVYYNENGILQSHTTNYSIYNKKSKKRMFSGYDKDTPIHLLIIDRNFHLSKKEAQEILDKYKINKEVSTIESGDSVNVAPYNKLRKDFPWIVKRLNKVPDSVTFDFTKDHFLGKKVRIKW